jgi:ligand-binding SRPBCC domain-containing protein
MEISKQSNIYRLYHQQFLPISKRDAWRFFSTPQNLQKITPEELDFRMTSPDEGKVYLGQIITYSIRLNKVFKMNWVTEITGMIHENSFVDEQRFGPYKMWHHRHTFEEVDGGVLMTDVVHFKIPFSLIAPLAYRFFIKQNLKRIFSYRTEKLDELISSNQLV